MNTLKKLDDIAASPPFTIEFNGNYLIMTITKGEENIFSWEVKIFEKTESELYKLNQDTVQEVSFPVEDVIASLEQQFDILEAKDSKGNKASDESNRIFFVCKKK